MGSHLTITKLKDTGKLDGYQNHKCYVTFHDDDLDIDHEDVYAAFKEVPEVGTKRYGNVTEGEYGLRFKSEQLPDGEYTPTSSPKATGGASASKTGTSSYNGDGARQGMAINNAATYVIAQLAGERLSPEEFADETKEYAKAIYKIDLNAQEDPLDII